MLAGLAARAVTLSRALPGPSHEEFHVNGHFHCEIIFSSPCFGSMV
ncbi:hypothetical protein SXCC_02685 [Gluconacetobacter sp. SXCC-1]|nr:hypothetical protein SXCC_02685 [Gluconacetobacter sp. SXCC-1]